MFDRGCELALAQVEPFRVETPFFTLSDFARSIKKLYSAVSTTALKPPDPSSQPVHALVEPGELLLNLLNLFTYIQKVAPALLYNEVHKDFRA